MAADRPPTEVTLVIGAGGVRCVAALGVVKALADAGIGIERVVGCGTGAVFAALVAFGDPMDASRALAARLWPRELAGGRGMPGFLRSVMGLRDKRATQLRQLDAAFRDRQIEGAALPLHLTATDFATGDLVELAYGSLAQGLRAGLALPPALAPQRLGERLLVDGAWADPLPVSVAIRHGARVIVAVGFELPLHAQAHGARRSADQLAAILANNLLRAKLAFHSAAHHAELIMVLPEFRQRAGLLATDRLAYLIDEGEQAALQQLPYLHHLLATA
ncbi:patatin-like phospholipase family protein [uncultured Ramlibacter sp.]|uniref:patatin-like phospholipase family protein n=1 Tax=uncultured Ramlibacter sp. TaxID=260755 RepID=UPI002608059B|nr:patatin-like phospholipase family protein [uncultured Ramlibacter sp.]